MKEIYKHFEDGFEEALDEEESRERRLGAELKFPLVRPDGRAVEYETIEDLWQFLCEKGWEPEKDSAGGHIVGATKPGEQNHTVASCETGYCKTEFSLAHVSNLFDLADSIGDLLEELEEFATSRDVHFLGYGIQPVTPPGEDLLMKKSRTSVWDKIFASNEYIPEEHGDDFHLFTINSASHVHVSVDREEAIPLVNVLNGFAAGQIAMTAHSNIWKGRVDPNYKCVAEKFWDWWMPKQQRVGVPEKPFEDLRDYVETISAFQPVFVKRDGKPIILDDYDKFADYFQEDRATGKTHKGDEIEIEPKKKDIDLHGTCYWYNARLSHYYTVENRLNDQQPPGELACISALTLGLSEALEEAHEEIMAYSWSELRAGREEACRHGLEGETTSFNLHDFAKRLLEIARSGLTKREMGEEVFLKPLFERLEQDRCPADEAEKCFKKEGIDGLVKLRSLRNAEGEKVIMERNI